jgi:rod shape-determining protein MreC
MSAIVVGLVFLVLIFYFRSGVFKGLSVTAHTIFRPVMVLSNAVSSKFSGIGNFFSSKNSLIKENESLRESLTENFNQMTNYNSLVDENNQLKEILNRKQNPNMRDNMVLGAILEKPNHSAYDTIIIDIGENHGVKAGDIVFADGYVPIGRVDTAFRSTSKIVLFSTSRVVTEVIVSGQNIFMQLVGRGGGNFEMILPRDSVIEKGTEVVLPGMHPYTVAVVETTISDPRDAAAHALLVSPVNIQHLKFVQVKKE